MLVYLFGVGFCYVAYNGLGTHYVALADFELTIFLLQVPECWDYKHKLTCLMKICSIHSLRYHVLRS